MKYQILKANRIPHESIYNLVLTLVLAFAIVWIIYVSVPYFHYSLYLIEPKQNKKKLT
jgi:hypothetical protein